MDVWNGRFKALASGELYDPDAKCWTRLPSMNKSRSNFALIVLDGRIWAIDGDGDVVIYDTVTESWSKGPSHALKVFHYAAALRMC